MVQILKAAQSSTNSYFNMNILKLVWERLNKEFFYKNKYLWAVFL